MSVAAQLRLPFPAPQPGAEGRLHAGPPLRAARAPRPPARGRARRGAAPAAAPLPRAPAAPAGGGDRRGRRAAGLARPRPGRPRAPPNWSDTGLAAATFCVVDLETTGGSPGYSKVTEIGAVRVRGLRIEERFSTLVDPGRPIPAVVTDLTGIDDRMVAGSPEISVGLAVRRLRRPGRAGGPQRPLRPALPQLRAPSPRGALLHPAVARHAPARPPAAERPGGAPRPRHARRLGRHVRAPVAPRAPGRRGHRRGARGARRPARRARRGHAEEDGRVRRDRRRAPRLQAGARRGPAVAAGRLRHARPPRQGPLRRQGGQPAPPRALLLRAGRAPRAPDRARPRAARVHRARDVRLRVRGPAARGRPHQEPAPPVQPARDGARRPVPEARLGPRGARLYLVHAPPDGAAGLLRAGPLAPAGARRGGVPRAGSTRSTTRTPRSARPPSPPSARRSQGSHGPWPSSG